VDVTVVSANRIVAARIRRVIGCGAADDLVRLTSAPFVHLSEQGCVVPIGHLSAGQIDPWQMKNAARC